MAYKLMSISKTIEDEKDQFRWEANDSVTGTSIAGASIIIPSGSNGIGFTVICGSGSSYKIQAATDSIYTLENDESSITWYDHPSGTLSTNFQDLVNIGASAIRLYSVSGTNASTIKVSAK